MKLKTTGDCKILCPVCGHPEFRSKGRRKKGNLIGNNDKFICPRGHVVTYKQVCRLVPVDQRNVPHPFWN